VDAVHQDGDLVHIVFPADGREQATQVLTQGPEVH